MSDYNILHICGYAHHKNNLAGIRITRLRLTTGQPLQRALPLRKAAGCSGQMRSGGFDNNPQTLIDSGSEEEVCKFVDQNFIKENGHRGYIMGADCSIPE